MRWISIHFYPVEEQNLFLSRAFKPFLEQYIWPNKETRAFFVRYQDEKGPHLRLRMRGESAWLEDLLLPAFEGWMRGRGEWEEVAYEAEAARFGGETAMAWAEEHFHVSTRVALDRITRDQFTYGDAMYDALRLNCLVALGAGFTREKTGWYFGQLYEQWLTLFLNTESGTDEINSTFEGLYSGQQASLQPVLQQFWEDASAGKLDVKQPEWLRWLRGNELILEGMGDCLAQSLPSLIHLSNNRMGINNQDEVYLNYILSKAL